MLFCIKELFQYRKQSSERPLEQDFCLQSGLEVTSKTVSEQMISSSRRQAAINSTRMRPELTFKDLECLLGMEGDFLMWSKGSGSPAGRRGQEGTQVHAPVLGKGMESGAKDACRATSF